MKLKLTREGVHKLLFFAAGILLYTLALNLFLVGNNIAAGGFAGVATVLNYIMPVQVGTIVFVMNIPVFLISIRVKGWRFTLTTLVACFLFTMLLNLTDWLPTLTTNKLLASIFGGILYGVGMACLVMGDSSVGGTDMVNRLLVTRFKGVGVGMMSLFVDGFVVLFAMVVFQNVEIGLYAMLTILICSLVADGILRGATAARLCLVISGKETADALAGRLEGGVTRMEATGVLAEDGRSVSLVAVRPAEAPRLKQMVAELDKGAAVVVLHANEVLGEGLPRRVMPAAKEGATAK